MLHKHCLCVDFAVDSIRLVILSLYLTLLMVTAVSVVWISRRQRSSIMEIEWHAPIPFLEYKSLESTMNDFDENAFRQPVDDLGIGVLDQQSEEVDADESPNNINFLQQLASLECTADGKLTAPQNKIELSAFTEQSKIFGSDFTTPSIVDHSGRIDVNFSAIQQVGKDDLDEMGNDLERGSSNMCCLDLFSNGQNMSDHIVAELNMAHTVVKNDEDVSITDSMHFPLQDVSKSVSKDKKASLNKEWVADTEDIAMNPCATAPCESGEEPKQIVVFDFKRSTLLPVMLEEDEDYMQALLANSSSETPKSFVLDVNDNLPKSNDGMLNFKRKNSGFSDSRARKKNKRDENEIPDTVPVHKVVITPKYEKEIKRETVVCNDGACNMCVTQALPVNMMLLDKQTQQKCLNFKYENDSENFSDTQTFNVILPNNNTSPERQQTALNENLENLEPRRSIVYEEDKCDKISVTQAIPSNILPEKVQLDDNKDNNEAENIIITQSFSNNIVAIDSKTSRHKMSVYENDIGNISITQIKQQLKPGYGEEKPMIYLSTFSKPRSKKTTTIVNDNDENHILMTESVCANIIAESKNNKNNIVYDENLASTSMALAIIANNYLLDELDAAVDIKKPEEIKEVKEKVTDDDIIEEAINKIKTIACDQVDRNKSNIFITGAKSTNIIGESTNERKTIAYDDLDSKSLVISTNVYLLDKLDSAADITKPIINYQVIDDDVFEQNNLKPTEDTLQDNRKSSVFVAIKFNSEPSMTMGIATVPSLLQTEKRRTVIYNHKCNISMKHPTPPETISDETESSYTTKTKLSKLTKQNLAANPPSDIKVLQAITTNSEQLAASISEQINLVDPIDRVPTYVKVQKANNWKVASPNTQKVLSLPIIPVSAIVMPVHPKGIEKLQVKLITSTTDRTIDEVSEGDEDSVTNESLPNISYQNLQRGTNDKSSMAILESDASSAVIPQDAAENTSTESMFYIMKDSEFITQTDRKMINKPKKANPKDEEEQVVHLQRQLSELKIATQNSALPSRSFEIDKRNEHIEQQIDNSSRLSDTQDLLDLISNFTGSVAEDQGETIEHKRVSVALNGPSKTLDREDFLRNIVSQTSLTCEEKFSPLKQTAVARLTFEEKFSPLKKNAVARLSFEEKFSPLKKTAVASLTCEEKFSPLKKTAVASLTCEEKFSPLKKNAVAALTCKEKFSPIKKTAVAALTCKEKFSPLKKTAFGETSYMYETKEKVIPTYFKDDSDGIKELMQYLVKPVSNDDIQIRLIDRDETQNTSTHSAQIQADLGKSSHNAAVLVFDHLNPLNNVLLSPNYSKNEHNPSQTDETHCGSGILLNKTSIGINYEAETFTTTQFTMMPEPTTMQHDIYVYQKDDRFSKKDDQFSSHSTTSGSISVDQSADAISRHLRNEKVNSIMEMRKNEELFGASLSLELVEDASQDANRALPSESNKHKNLKLKFSISPHVNIQGEAVKVKAATLSGISMRQRFNRKKSRVSVTNSKTRNNFSLLADRHEKYSPSEEKTPKPISRSSKPHKVSAVLSSPDDPTKSLRTEEMFFIFVDQSFRPADPVFDHLTPVNNILNSPTDLTDAHKNDARKTVQTLFGSASSPNKMCKGDYEVEEASTTTQNTMVPGQHTDNTLTELVKDESESENRVLTPDKEHSNHRINSSRSVLVDSEGQAPGIDSIAKITRISLGDHYYRSKSRVTNVKNNKNKICIPSTDKHKKYLPSVKVTRKPITKMQKISTNPKSRIEPSTELYSADDFPHSMAPEKYVTETNNRDAHASTICDKKLPETKETSVFSIQKPCTSAVLDFDHVNPLNNILLTPNYSKDEHNRSQTDETRCGSGILLKKIYRGKNYEAETFTTTQITMMPEPSTMQDDIYVYQEDQFSSQSTTSGSISVDQSADAIFKHLRNEKVNSMEIRKNEELLGASLSLELVEDASKNANRALPSDSIVDQSFRPADPVFDRLTPVNNILYSPTDLPDAHKNDPRKTDQRLFGSASSFNKMSTGDYEIEEALTATRNTMVLTELLNILHAFVNDESESENRVLTPDKEHSNHRIYSSISVLVDSEGEEAGRYQYYRTKSRVKSVNYKKHICNPSTNKHKKYSPFVKVIRKPITKMQKISKNPKSSIEPSTELYSADDFTHSMSSVKDVTETNNTDAPSLTIEKKSLETKETSVFSVHKPCTSAVLDFDHLNPLNNILLAPTYYMEVHKYNPRHTNETLCSSGSPFNKISKGNDSEAETVTITLYTKTPEPKKKKKK